MDYINLEYFFNLEREGKKSVIDFCLKMGFIANSYECPECKKPMKLICNKDRNQDGFGWFCRHKNRVQRSIRHGTWFEDSRLSLPMMLKLAYLWVNKTSHVFIYHELKLSKCTVCEWMSFFRKVCVNAIKKEGIFIGGPNEIVEIDAKCFSSVKNKKGGETWVFGGVERSSKNCFLEIIQSGEESEIVSILKKYVRSGTTIISDTWKGYDCLESNGYVHKKFSKTSGFKDQASGIHKNNILSLWGRVKKIVCTRIGKDQFETYLAEIMWRRLRRGDPQEMIMSFFKIISHIFIPKVRDDPSKQIEKGDNMKTQSKEVDTDNREEETQLKELNGIDNEQEIVCNVQNRENHSTEESACDVLIWDNQLINESVCDVVSSENQLIEESVCDVLTPENQFIGESQSKEVNTDNCEGGEFEEENGRQKKRLKTMESADT